MPSLYSAKTNQDSTANYKKHFDSISIIAFDFYVGLEIEDVHRLESQNNLNPNINKLKVDKDTPKVLLICIS